VIDERDLNWNVDMLSYMEIDGLVKSLGYSSFKCLWYCDPRLSFSRGLRPLNKDNDVLKFIGDVKGFEIVDVYVEHKVDNPLVVSDPVVEDVSVQAEAREKEPGVSENVGHNEDLSEDDSEYVASESDVDDDENWVADSDFEAEFDWSTVLPKETFATKTEKGPTKKGNSSYDAIFDDESCDSDELRTPPGSDDEDVMQNHPKYKDSTELVVGMTFNNKGQVSNVIKDYGMYKQKNISLKQNDSKRMVVKCVKGCPFHIRFSKRIGNQFWQLVSIVDDHKCNRTPQNKLAKTEWLAKKFMHTLRVTPDMKPKGLVAEAIDKWGVKLSQDQAYRANRRAIEMIQGAGREQFSHLRTYANELRNSNQNSTVIIKCAESNTGPVFERIYVCLEACKAGFAYTCRPLIGLDACFLKGDF
jgi:hypothetical protein